jgi:hypothetical protein
MAVTQETLEVQRKASEEAIWFAFLVNPEFRRFNTIANRQMLDEYLTKQGQALSIENLSAAVSALGNKLGELDPTNHAKRKAAQASADYEAAQAGAKAAADAAAAPIDRSILPADITRKFLVNANRDAIKELIQKHSKQAVYDRLNGVN